VVVGNSWNFQFFPGNVGKTLDDRRCNHWRLVPGEVVILLGDGRKDERIVRFLGLVVLRIGRDDVFGLVLVEGIWLVVISWSPVFWWRRNVF
jgi:hypothetical protein